MGNNKEKSKRVKGQQGYSHKKGEGQKRLKAKKVKVKRATSKNRLMGIF